MFGSRAEAVKYPAQFCASGLNLYFPITSNVPVLSRHASFFPQGFPMESVLVKVVSFIAVIVVGYLLKRVGFFRSEDFRLIAGLVLKVTLPCAIISNFTRIDVDAALFVLVLLGLGCNLVTVAAGWLASKRGDSAEQAFNIINFSGYNVGCFALPFLQSFVSPMGVVAACIWDTGNSIMCTGATYSIAAAVAGKNEGGGARLLFRWMFMSP